MSEVLVSNTFDGTPFSEAWGPPTNTLGGISIYGGNYCISTNLRLRMIFTGDISIDIYHHTDYQPDGISLASGTASVDTSGAFADVDIPLTSSFSLQPGSFYMIIFSVNADILIACSDDGVSNLNALFDANGAIISATFTAIDPIRYAWFQLTGNVGQLPAPAQFVSPIDGAIFSPPDSIILDWNDGGGDYPATKYRWNLMKYDDDWVEIWTTVGQQYPPTTQQDVTTRVESAYEDDDITHFGWRVQSGNANGWQDFSDDYWTFIYKAPPGKAQNPTPEDDEEDIIVGLIKLEWEAPD